MTFILHSSYRLKFDFGLFARVLIAFFLLAISFKAASAEFRLYHKQSEWQKAALSSEAKFQEIEFFAKEKDDLTGHNLQPGAYNKVVISGVTFETVSEGSARFFINPYADPYAGVLFSDGNSTLRIYFEQAVWGFFLSGGPSGLGAPLIRTSASERIYEFGHNTAFIGFISDNAPIHWIEITPTRRFDLDKLIFYRVEAQPPLSAR